MTKALSAAYSATGGDWARGPERIYQRLASAMVACSPVPLAGRTIVDVGAGTGAAGRAAVAAGAASVVAVDAAIGMLRHAAATRPPAVVADARALPFGDATFDGAIAAFSLNHIAAPADGLKEMARVTTPGSPIVAAAYAVDDTHPVKQAVEAALVAAGWEPPDWYDELRQSITPLLATTERCRRALAAAGLDRDARVEELRVAFPELQAADLVRWRFGMAQHAPFVAALPADAATAVAGDALVRLGECPPTLVRSVLVMSTIAH